MCAVFDQLLMNCLLEAPSCGRRSAGALDIVDNFRPFHTDASMKTPKPMHEFKTRFMAMPKADREMMLKECQEAAMSEPCAEFCANVNCPSCLRMMGATCSPSLIGRPYAEGLRPRRVHTATLEPYVFNRFGDNRRGHDMLTTKDEAKALADMSLPGYPAWR